MSKKLITLEKAVSTTDSISKIGLEYIELAANANNPPTVKQDTKFHILNSSGVSRYIIETGDQAFSWGVGSFPAISDGTWYLYCSEAADLGNTIPDVGTYGASKNVPTYDQTKNGWYNSDGKTIGTFTVASSVVSGITIINSIQVDDSGDIEIDGAITAVGDIETTGAMKATGGYEAIYRDSSGTETKVVTKTKIIEIGDWNMNTTVFVSINHGLSNWKKIRSINGIIRNDSQSSMYHLIQVADVADPFLVSLGINQIQPSTIAIIRRTGGIFDAAGWSATSFNRGWLYIVYEE